MGPDFLSEQTPKPASMCDIADFTAASVGYVQGAVKRDGLSAHAPQLDSAPLDLAGFPHGRAVAQASHLVRADDHGSGIPRSDRIGLGRRQPARKLPGV